MTALRRRQVERAIRRFVLSELLERPFHGGDPLAEDAVDSLGQEQLADYIEQRWGVRLRDEDMVAENFANVPTLAALVVSKR